MSETQEREVAQIKTDKQAALLMFSALERETVLAVQEGEFEVAAGYAGAMFLYASQLPAWWAEFAEVSDALFAGEGSRADSLTEGVTRAAFRRLKEWAEATGHPVNGWFEGAGEPATPDDLGGETVPWEGLNEQEKAQVAGLLRAEGLDLDSVEDAAEFYGDPEAVEEALNED